MVLRTLIFLAFALPCFAERESFADDKYSLDFPDGWKELEEKADPPPLIARTNADGSALFSVTSLPVPEGAVVDLDDTAKVIAESYQKDLKMPEPAEVGPGEIDGLASRFLAIIPPVEKPAAEGEEGEGDEEAAAPSAAYFLVLVDTGKGVLILQATLALPAPKAVREEAMKIIQSFKRE